MTYEDLDMEDVLPVIDLTQFYFASKDPPRSTMMFEVTFRNIRAKRAVASSSTNHHQDAISFQARHDY